MYFYGTLRLLSSAIFSCLIFSRSWAFAECTSLLFWFSTYLIFEVWFSFSDFSTICFFSCKACFFKSSFLSFSSFSSSYLISRCFLIAFSNSAFSALACSSSILYFSICCSRRASFNSAAFLALISASCLYF
jgi:hypothetical protein